MNTLHDLLVHPVIGERITARIATATEALDDPTEAGMHRFQVERMSDWSDLFLIVRSRRDLDHPEFELTRISFASVGVTYEPSLDELYEDSVISEMEKEW